MTVTTISSREFNRDISRAKRAAEAGPVFVTDRGRPAYVLLRYEAYQRLAGPPKRLLDAVAMPSSDDTSCSIRHAWVLEYSALRI
jgi:hypothetical protein